MKTKIAIPLSIIIVLTVGFVSEVKAGDRAIHIDQEGFREVVDETTGSVNHNDCIFWNESAWRVSSSAAHLYFTELETGN